MRPSERIAMLEAVADISAHSYFARRRFPVIYGDIWQLAEVGPAHIRCSSSHFRKGNYPRPPPSAAVAAQFQTNLPTMDTDQM